MEATSAIKNGAPSHDSSIGPVANARLYGMTVHAVLPPPVTGMSLCTEAIARSVAERAVVRRYNWSNGSPRITRWFQLVKGLRSLTTPIRLLLGRRPRHGVFYMPCNRGLAVAYNALAISAARLRGYRCVLHHHYFRYVDRYQLRIAFLTKLLGHNDLQIVLCPAMERGFRSRYGQKLPLAIVPSTVQLLGSIAPQELDIQVERPRVFVIGHLTNLQIDKGLDLVFEVLRTLLRRGRDVKLVLAGPAYSDVEKAMVESAQTEFGDRLDYRGPAYGEDKRRFYRDIHTMIYPTRNDAQPLVVMEAFSHGRPVLSFGRGCIPGMLPRPNWSIAVDADFVELATRELERWIDDPDEYTDNRRLARTAYDVAIRDAQIALNEFVDWVLCRTNSEFVLRGE